ncbi:MAG TPA: hypothetical protein VGI03_03195 [Verrucomicrobiae bacterium]|jgi:hypothetical protein
MKKILFVLPLTIAFLATTPAKAQIVFSDDFSSGLTAWNSNGQGIVVPDATYGQALGFTQTAAGSGVYTTTFNVQAGEWINFAYEGIGGFLGLGRPGASVWLAGENAYYSVPVNLANSTDWTSYSVYDPSYTGAINFEDFSGVPGSALLTAEFADITVSDSPIVTAPTSAAVPEASTVFAGGMMLLPLGMSLLRILRRKPAQA